MAELTMLADIQRTVYPEEVTRQLHAMAQGRESSLVIDRPSNQLCYATNRASQSHVVQAQELSSPVRQTCRFKTHFYNMPCQ